MLKQLELENFKAFGERVSIPFAPITLIFGENSAGKSSILQSLYLLKQSREFKDHNSLLLTGMKNGYVNLGSYSDMVFEHSTKDPLGIKIINYVDDSKKHFLTNPNELEKSIYFYTEKKKDFLCGIEFLISQDRSKENLLLTEFSYYLNDTNTPWVVFKDPKQKDDKKASLNKKHNNDYINFAPKIIIENKMYWEKKYSEMLKGRELFLEHYKKIKDLYDKKNWAEKPDNNEYGITAKSEKYNKMLEDSILFFSEKFSLEAFVKRVQEYEYQMFFSFGKLFAQYFDFPVSIMEATQFDEPDEMGPNEIIDYLSFYANKETEIYKEITINHLIPKINEEIDKMFSSFIPISSLRNLPERFYIFSGIRSENVGSRGEYFPEYLYTHREILKPLNEWFKRLKIDYELKILPIKEITSEAFLVLLQDTINKKKVQISIADVGFGFSQILPFIIQSLIPGEKIISIEQPEVHIHPKLQADLGDLLAATIKPPYNKQFLIETHSEHLVLRMQKLVRKKELKPEDVSILYVSRSKNGSNVKRLNLDEEGDFIDEWPGGFFMERLNEFID